MTEPTKAELQALIDTEIGKCESRLAEVRKALPETSNEKFILRTGRLDFVPAWVSVPLAQRGGLCIVPIQQATVFTSADEAYRCGQTIRDGRGRKALATGQRMAYEAEIRNLENIIDALHHGAKKIAETA